jgi:hypothetical protein
MFTSELSVTYEKKIGDVVYTIKSESLPNTRLDMVDSLVALIKRELEQGIEPSKKSELSPRLRMDIGNLV